MPVEVERKFVCDSDIQVKLKKIGAVCIGQHQFKDQYFDSQDFTLTLRDFWLRKREGQWELKCPAKTAKQQQRAEALCTNYREVTDLPHIKAELTGIIENCMGTVEDVQDSSQMSQFSSSSQEEMWLKDLKLQCFAEFTTMRCSYVLDDIGEENRVQVDLDEADFGYCVGEIEVLVSEGGNMQSALQRIEMTAEKLGLGDEKIQGKMHVFLQRYRPDHYAQLVSAHVL